MKPRPDLIPPKALLAVARVLALGASKHGEHRPSDRPWREDYAAALRHAFEWAPGAPLDAESGESALAHAAARLLLLLGAELRGELAGSVPSPAGLPLVKERPVG